MRRRIHSLFLAAALLLTLLTACAAKEEAATAASLLEDMTAAMADAGSFRADVQFSGTVESESNGLKLSVPLDMDLDLSVILAPLRLHATGSAGLSVMGMDMDLPLELYAQEQDEEIDSYVRVMDAWVRQSAETAGLDSTLTLMDGEYPESMIAAAVLREEPEEVLGRTVRRVDIALTGDMLEEALAALSGEAKEAAEQIDWSAAAADVTVWIEPETCLPVRQTVSLTAPVRGAGSSVQSLELLVDYTEFGTVDTITIPAEALNASIEDFLEGVA